MLSIFLSISPFLPHVDSVVVVVNSSTLPATLVGVCRTKQRYNPKINYQHKKKTFCQIIFNSDYWFQRRRFFKFSYKYINDNGNWPRPLAAMFFAGSNSF